MASLTELSLLASENTIMNNETTSAQNPKPNNNKNWFNVVYLCVEKSGDNIFNGFKCYPFPNIPQADAYLNKYLTNTKMKKYTIIPMCRYIPVIFHRVYLNYSLKKIYWNNDITILPNNKY